MAGAHLLFGLSLSLHVSDESGGELFLLLLGWRLEWLLGWSLVRVLVRHSLLFLLNKKDFNSHMVGVLRRAAT